MDVRQHPLTLTHARLRRAQGDVRGAIEIVEAMIDTGNEADELWQLYLALGGERQRPHREVALEPQERPVASSSEDLAAAFRQALHPGQDRRVERLEGWLRRLQREAYRR
jgi:hypothetical protein